MIQALAFLSSFVLLWLYQRVAPRLGLIDTPNARSQHREPVVVGGGVVIAIALASQIVLSAALSDLGLRAPELFAGLIVLLALVGLLDDRFNLGSGIRLVIYGVVSACALWFETSGLTGLALLASTLMLVWVINLTNFMDGLDGFLVSHTLSVLVALALLGLFSEHGSGQIAALSIMMLVVLTPFLWFNWPPARMFMGDAGSVFIGFYLGMLGVLAALESVRFGFAWLILMMPFLVDATLTLIIRLSQGHLPHIAHRDHAYQRLARITDSALTIDLGLLALHGLWQFPLAWWAMTSLYSPLIMVIISVIPSLLILAYARRAG